MTKEFETVIQVTTTLLLQALALPADNPGRGPMIRELILELNDQLYDAAQQPENAELLDTPEDSEVETEPENG